MIWQHPELAVDPRLRMRDTLNEAVNAATSSDTDTGAFAKTAAASAEPQARLLDAFDIDPCWLNRYPHELSGGELQRFCIVRALSANPRYLIADEISTMLDALTQARIWHALSEEAEKRSLGMLIVTHSPALTQRIATRTVSLCNKESPPQP
jgi:peptide/nickel transport system ATP-binding protein